MKILKATNVDYLGEFEGRYVFKEKHDGESLLVLDCCKFILDEDKVLFFNEAGISFSRSLVLQGCITSEMSGLLEDFNSRSFHFE